MINFGTSFALAVLQGAPATGGGSLVPFAIQIVLIVLILYFLMIRPQQKQRRRHEDALRSLKRGDQVVTAGGIIGEVIHIRETTKDGGTNRLDDQVTIKSAESRLIVERGRIAKILGASSAPSTSSSSSSAT